MYTKGPWKRAGNLIYASTKTQHRFLITVTAPKGIEGTAPPEELEANVQLILACPDMYEALKETAIILETMVDAGMIGKSLKVCSLVEQALAKAEGTEEEETSMELQLFTPVYSGQESQERKDTMDTKMKYDCYDFNIEKAFGVSFVFISPDWERFLNSFTDDYEKYPPRIAPNPHLARLGLYYFDKDVAVLVTPAGIYQYRGASLTLRGPAYLPLSYFFEMWGE